MDTLNLANELREEKVKAFFGNYDDNSLASVCETSIYTGLDLYGICSIIFEDIHADFDETKDEWREWKKTEKGEDIILDYPMAPIVDEWVRSDKGLHVVTMRNEWGMITSIHVTLESNGNQE